MIKAKIYACCCIALACWSCHHAKMKPGVHLASVSQPGYTLTVDAINNSRVMQKARNDIADTRFASFRICLVDSVTTDKKAEINKQKYFDYDLQKDWVALSGADSLYPVFFQPVNSLDRLGRQGILVFELPVSAKIDALLYRDSFGPWKLQQFYLKDN